MDAGFVAEGVLPDDGLVGLHHDARQRADQPRDRGDLRRVHPCLGPVEVLADLQAHDDLFERGVARALADAVDRAFDLIGAVCDRGERVGNRQPQVVVAVHAHARLGDVGHALLDGCDQPPELIGNREPDGVRDVHRRRAGVDDGFQHLEEKLRFGARGVLRRELDVAAEALGVLDRPHGLAQDLIFGFAQLVFQVDGRGRQEHMDALLGRSRQGLRRRLDVAGKRARQRADRRALDRLGDHAHRLRVTRRGDGKAALDDIDP